MGLFGRLRPEMITADEALPGRDETMPVAAAHLVIGNPRAFTEGLKSSGEIRVVIY